MPRMLAIKNEISQTGDSINTFRLEELIQKLNSESIYLAFAGHFSAGKSLMINKLLNTELLPSSPIPTSANVVLVGNGDPEILLQDNNANIYKLTEEMPIEELKKHFKNGDDIQKVLINGRYGIPSKAVLIDTPGIDSTDAAHKLAAESVLHLADILFYVTDYNHVQSQENYGFVREMVKRGKQVILIVNQIDKHREEELKFIDFQRHIETSFSGEDFTNLNIFYTSLLNEAHPHNEYYALKSYIHQVIESKDEVVYKQSMNSLKALVKNHLEKQEESNEISLQQIEQYILEEDTAAKELYAIDSEIAELEGTAEKKVAHLKEDLKNILKNANIIPYQTREAARRYLEASDSSFKVGFLFSRKKTEEELENRKNQLLTELKEHTSAMIDWHFREALTSFVKEVRLAGYSEQTSSFQTDIPGGLPNSCLKKGASYTDAYLMNYCRDLSEAVKKQSLMTAVSLLELLQSSLKDSGGQEEKALRNEAENLRMKLYKITQTVQAAQYVKNHSDKLNSFCKGKSLPDLNIKAELSNLLKPAIPLNIENFSSLRNSTENAAKDVPVTQDRTFSGLNSSRAASAARELRKIPSLKGLADDVEKKLERLNRQQYTVALFGAFSAGKSSFANAIIGERVLPSSPAPTTASINKIAPVTSEKHHGTVDLIFKTADEVTAELNELLQPLQLNISHLHEFGEVYKAAIRRKSATDALKHSLKVFHEALEKNSRLLSEGVGTADIHSFQSYAAEEIKACLVREIIIYFDCPLTRTGITLVDTPGADSLNARHTAVAFDYIKNADAILFVTYYNHPFSKGDRAFLKQLGRVKDTFALDKMFFLVNAVDLAADEKEALLVKNYIKEQLSVMDIRNPRIYGISSLNILKNLGQSYDYSSFQEDFEEFVKRGLSSGVISSIQNDIRRAAAQIEAWIEASAKSQEKRLEDIAVLQGTSEKVLKTVDEVLLPAPSSIISQELTEQIYYMEQRISFQFSDYFKEAFHPGLFTRYDKKTALMIALQELLESVNLQAVQELQALSLRMERFLMNALSEQLQNLQNEMKVLEQGCIFSAYNKEDISTPPIKVELKAHPYEDFQQELSLFKNTKAFFEKNEKKLMSEALQERVGRLAAAELSKAKENFTDFYEEVYENVKKDAAHICKKEAEQYYSNLMSVYEKPLDTSVLQQLMTEMNKVLHEQELENGKN